MERKGSYPSFTIFMSSERNSRCLKTSSHSPLECHWIHKLGEFTPSYILHTRAFMTYLLGGFAYLVEKIIIKVMVFYL
jgi:hypothetical protein